MTTSGSTFFGPSHPLDVDLADLAEGLIDDPRREQLTAHLADCLLCRIKLRRLREATERGELAGAVADADRASMTLGQAEQVEFFVPSPEAKDGGTEPSVGEIWSAGGSERILVLVIDIIEDRAVVAPLTFDIESADEETIVVEAQYSPFPVPVAVYAALATDVPRSVLRSKLGELDQSDDLPALLNGTLTGTRRGAQIDGPTDPRLEFRQVLIDRVGSLEDIAPDPDTSADSPPPTADEVAAAITTGLRERRGHTCRVRRLFSWDDLGVVHSRRWVPVATIDEVGVLLVVFDTPSGLSDDLDFDAARAVLTRFNGSALVVLATAIGEMADVFDAYALNFVLRVPSGDPEPPRPLLSELVPLDAITKFLEQYTPTAATWPSRGAVPQVDVAAVLAECANRALTNVVLQGERAKIPFKIEGYSSLHGEERGLSEALSIALDGQPVIEALNTIAMRSDE